MTMLQIIFYALSALAVGSGMMTVASTNPVRGVLFLVLTFFATAGLWLLLHAEFLALVLVLVYVGAVMTLFLFVVMMLNPLRATVREGFVRFVPIVLLMVLMLTGMLIMILSPERFGLVQMPVPFAKPANFSNTAALGAVLYTHFAYPFEIAAVILLAAIVAAITLTHQPRKAHKTQNIAQQNAVQAKNRLRLVDMPSTPKINPNSTGQ